MSPSVVVVGGGLAGIAAAVHLADRGAEVTLLEARPHLGGATYSFPRGDLTVDTGQHVFLRCYAHYRDLLKRLGVADLAPVQEQFTIPVLYDGGRIATLRRARRLPAPLHLGPALVRYAALSVPERLAAGSAALALRSVDPGEPGNDTRTFGDWLRQHRQSARSIERLWGLIAVAALNLHPDEASLALAAKVFRTGLLEEPAAADIGVPAVPLRRLHADPATRLLDRLGVRVHPKTKTYAVERAETTYVIRTRDGELAADAVVVAVPHQAAAQIVPTEAAPTRERWAGLGAAPIVNVHVLYDRPVTRLPFAAAPDSSAQWVFNRTQAAGVEPGRQYLVVSVSDAAALLNRPADDLCRTHLAALAELFPAARDARVVESFVTREPHATFRQAPGTAALRPAAQTRLPGLVLAGAWTATGWPDTMEGAVRSGVLAADSIHLTKGRLLTEATP